MRPSMRLAAVALMGLCSATACGSDSAGSSADTTVENRANKYTHRQCSFDTRALKTAEEAYRATSSPAAYADEAALVPGFLSERSPLHEVVVDGDSYRIYVTHPSCGTPDADGAAPWDAASDVTAPGNY